jgi:nucleotide-binding universal stress UspA family protein
MTTHVPPRILAAVDFGEASASGLALAGVLAETFGASLVVLHAETLEMPPYFTDAQMQTLEAERLEARAQAAEYIRRYAAQHTPVPVEPLVDDGPAVDAILRAARGVDLVVLGTHGRRGPRRWWLGSVAEAVVHDSPVPVLVTHALEPAALQQLRGGAALVLAPVSGGGVDAWVRALQDGLKIAVTRTRAAGACEPDEIRDADLVVVPLDAAREAVPLRAPVLQYLTQCPRPVLFVPAEAPAIRRPYPVER